jgi:excisionase family DNA binding protein
MMVNIKDAAIRMSVSTDLVRSEIECGNLPAYKIGRVVRIKEEDVQSYIAGKRIIPRSEANDNRKNATSAHRNASQKLRTILGGKS